MVKEGGRGKRTSGGIKSVKPQDTVGNANDGAVFNEVVRILRGEQRGKFPGATAPMIR